MKHQSKHIPLEQEQQGGIEQRTQNQSVHEFASVEEMLRYDAAQTKVPSAIATRLQESAVKKPPPPARSWWRRWLGG
ncbi:MAG TPA: hypothetical protein VFA77_11680 [Candidatus Eisenbacteria bacterium]|jgi:hypothetical protein|nr:hypothetical protein [Candidatus Eisenbacteria bacterium]